MLIWILEHVASLMERVESHATGDSRVFLMFRIALASVTSFLLAIFLGPIAIRWLKSRFREKISSDSETLNTLHAEKESTPTMGGLFIVAAVVVAVLLWCDLSSLFVQGAIFILLSFATLGALDDWIKLRTERNGLKAKTKFLLQSLFAGLAGIGLYSFYTTIPDGTTFIFPFGGLSFELGYLFLPWSVFILIGSSNGVNLTDGLDGLAAGCLIFAGGAFVALCYFAGHYVIADYFSIPNIEGCGELAVVMGAMVGAMLGFLWFNCYPAQVFMGDTGSLPMGALLGWAALVSKQEFLLAIVGGVFVVETLSVILQVGWFKMTKKRLIACSPLHNHYLFRGDHEMKIVVRFWICSALLGIIAIASLKIQ